MRIPPVRALGRMLSLKTACSTGLCDKRSELREAGEGARAILTDKSVVGALVLLMPGGVLIWIVWYLGWAISRWVSGAPQPSSPVPGGSE